MKCSFFISQPSHPATADSTQSERPASCLTSIIPRTTWLLSQCFTVRVKSSYSTQQRHRYKESNSSSICYPCDAQACFNMVLRCACRENKHVLKATCWWCSLLIRCSLHFVHLAVLFTGSAPFDLTYVASIQADIMSSESSWTLEIFQ